MLTLTNKIGQKEIVNLLSNPGNHSKSEEHGHEVLKSEKGRVTTDLLGILPSLQYLALLQHLKLTRSFLALPHLIPMHRCVKIEITGPVIVCSHLFSDHQLDRVLVLFCPDIP